MAALIARTEALIASGDATLFPPGSGDFGPCGTGLCPSDTLQYDRLTNEETRAAYAQLNMETEADGRPVNMRLGLRYEQTDVVSDALSPNYTGLVWGSGNELSLQSQGQTYTQGKGDYDYLLPNFDFSIDLTDTVIARTSLSRTLARPGFGDIQGGLTLDSPVRITGGTGRSGSPELLPYVSDNLDMSVEWYYGNGSYIAGGYFLKKVKNFIGTGSVDSTAGNLPHPALGPLGDEARAATGSSDGGVLYSWILANRPNAAGVDAVAGTITGVAGRDPASPFNLSVPVNIEEAEVDGLEFVIQHNFGDSGFGVIANATLVNGDVGYDDLRLRAAKLQSFDAVHDHRAERQREPGGLLREERDQCPCGVQLARRLPGRDRPDQRRRGSADLRGRLWAAGPERQLQVLRRQADHVRGHPEPDERDHLRLRPLQEPGAVCDPVWNAVQRGRQVQVLNSTGLA